MCKVQIRDFTTESSPGKPRTSFGESQEWTKQGHNKKAPERRFSRFLAQKTLASIERGKKFFWIQTLSFCLCPRSVVSRLTCWFWTFGATGQSCNAQTIFFSNGLFFWGVHVGIVSWIRKVSKCTLRGFGETLIERNLCAVRVLSPYANRRID